MKLILLALILACTACTAVSYTKPDGTKVTVRSLFHKTDGFSGEAGVEGVKIKFDSSGSDANPTADAVCMMQRAKGLEC